jgi:uncharacterized protein YcsI (UPF0317 family)
MQITTLPGSPQEIRSLIRSGELARPTSGLAPGYVQANLVIMPAELAFDFLVFCHRNPKPCPVIEVVEAGSAEPRQTAPGADLRHDVPKYRIYSHGELESEEKDISRYWRDDLVSFLLGCSFTFDSALVRSGISVRHIDQETTVPMFITNIQTAPAGSFSGPMVVSMRPIAREKVVRAVQVTSRFPSVHGAPVHIGDPAGIGVQDIDKPDFGDPAEIKEGEVPVFWACGVTPQVVAMTSKPPLMITHSPGHMFITDLHDEDLAIL